MASGLRQTALRSDLAAVATFVAFTLRSPRQVEPASAAAATVHRLFETSLKASRSTLELACAKGCSYCCHTFVAATAPEIFLVARRVAGAGSDGGASDPVRVLERARALAGVGIAQRIGMKAPCALLVDGSCSVYADRPTVCRQVTSTRVDDCIDEFEGRRLDHDITMARANVDHARNARLVLSAALAAIGLPVTAYELGGGVARVMTESDAERRWLAGEDVFAGLPAAPAETGAFSDAVSTLASDVRALL